MNITRRGKIARLPQHIREVINRHLRDGEDGKTLVSLLNRMPEVRAVMAAEFGGRPIREQNLSEWRQGGYREWGAQQEALEMAGRLGEEAAELRQKGGDLTEHLALRLTARYLAASRKLNEGEDGPDLSLLRQFCSDVVALRRGDHQAERLRIERERMTMEWKRLEFEGTRTVLAEHDSMGRFKRRITTGLETLMKHCKNNPRAMAALDALTEACQGPFDHLETESQKP
ncbi:MAG: hypothetical protein ABIP20_17165 [Chthoniobacteraceae bacterium]